jgi:hypothetical protein
MSPKALVRALATLGVLLFLWGAFALFRGSISDASAQLDLPKLTQADVDRITAIRGADTLVLARSDGAWRVNGFAADHAQVDQLFRALTDSAARSELLARSATSHHRLGVDTTGRSVVFSRGNDTLLSLVVGSQGTAYQTAYLRQAGTDDVFLYHGTLPGLLGRDQDAWRDRRIARIPEDTVGMVVLVRGGRSTALERADSGWTIASRPADSAAVSRLLQGLGDLTAIGFATPTKADSLDFTQPSRRLTVLSRTGDTLLALAVDSAADGYWVRRNGNPAVFRLDFWRIDQLIPTDSTLRRRTP